MKKEILIIDNSLGITGALKAILHVANSLHHAYDFHFAVPSKNQMVSNQIVNSSHKVLPMFFFELQRSISLVAYLPMLVYNGFKMAKYCRLNNISIVHVNDLYNMSGLLIKFFFPSVKLIYHVRLLSTSYGRVMYEIWIKLINLYADKIIVVSMAVQNDLAKHIRLEKVELIYDFLKFEERYNKAEAKQSEFTKLLYLSNFTQGKGHEYALMAVKELVQRGNLVKLTFAGDDFGKGRNIKFKNKLQLLSRTLDLDNCIIFLNVENDVEKLIKSHDIILNFSESESFSMTCYEALYYGKPLIASSCGGPQEIIEHDVTGILVPNKDLEAMVNAIQELASHSEKRAYLSKNARIDILKKRSEQNPEDAFNVLYSCF